MSDESVPEARPVSDEPVAVSRPEQGEEASAPSAGGEDGVVVRKRRRRGSRGGRNRRRPSSTGPGASDSDSDDTDDDDEDGDGDDAVDLTEKAAPAAAGRQSRSQPRAASGASTRAGAATAGTADDGGGDGPGADAPDQPRRSRSAAGSRRPSTAAATAETPADDPEAPGSGAGPDRPPRSGGRSRQGAARATAAVEPEDPTVSSGPLQVSLPGRPGVAGDSAGPAPAPPKPAPLAARRPTAARLPGADTEAPSAGVGGEKEAPSAGLSGGKATSPRLSRETAISSRPSAEKAGASPGPSAEKAGAGPGPSGDKAGGAAEPGERGRRASTGGRGRSAAASAASLEISAPAASTPAADAPSSRTTADAEDDGAPRRRRSRGRGRGGSGGGSGGERASSSSAAAAPATPAPASGRGRGGRSAAATADKARQSEVEAMLDELDEAAMERRKGRTRKGRPTGRYMMCVSVRPGVATQVAVLEGRSLVEHYVSRPTDTTQQIDGNIYLGKVQNVLPGMEAAFVDIGTPKNGVLYRDDVTFDESEIEGRRPKIERLLRNGQSVVVQVTKNPIGTKGARLTQEVSLAGRFVVMIPNQPGTYGISKRLSDDERKRLRKILDEIRPAENGLIVRTAADGASADELARDLKRLSAQWEDISKRAAKNRPAMLLHQEPDLAIRVIREEFNKEYRGVVIDDPALYEEIRRYVEAITPELADRVELYTDPLPIFERYHVHEQLHKALERKVWLPSGGSIIIERTEALTVIDVNTAKNVGRSNLEETVFANNLEAAEEVARQLRLRDIGGIIVIDFIDMEIRKNREEVTRKFKEALARDKTRTQVFDISELGLVEMTRKRISEGLVEAFSTICTTCEGRGIILDESLL
jgi:ribonuclease E